MAVLHKFSGAGFLGAVSLIACVAVSAVSRVAAVNFEKIDTVAGTGEKGYTGDGGPAAKAQMHWTSGLCRGPDGALYVCDTNNHVIRRIAKDGTISTVAGNGKIGYAGDGGAATAAQLDEPYEVRFDADGNMVFVEMKNNVVRQVSRAGIISTLCGTGKAGFSGDGGPAAKAQMNQPHSLQFDKAGNLYVCDIGNHRIRKIDKQTGIVSTICGTGKGEPTPDGARLEGTPLNGPRALDIDKDGNLWLVLRNGNALYKLDLNAGTIHHVAGTGKKGFTGDAGPALDATFSGPKGVSIAPDGNVYIADTENHAIRMIDPAKGTIELIAGTGQKGDGPDGPPKSCKLNRPHGVFVDADGTVFIGDSDNNRVRAVHPSGK